MEHHDLDVWPIPKDKKPHYINEPWLIESSIVDYYPTCTAEQLKAPDKEKDNIRVYVPLDINRNAILRRLHWLQSADSNGRFCVAKRTRCGESGLNYRSTCFFAGCDKIKKSFYKT